MANNSSNERLIIERITYKSNNQHVLVSVLNMSIAALRHHMKRQKQMTLTVGEYMTQTANEVLRIRFERRERVKKNETGNAGIRDSKSESEQSSGSASES